MHPDQLILHRDFVRSIARQLLADENQLDDVEQEIWVTATERAPAAVESLPAWLATCTRNLARQIRRGEARRAAREREVAREEPAPSPEEVLAREETRRSVVRAVLALDEHYRASLLLRYYEGLGYRAIAKRLGVPLETVRTRLRRGHQLLRERLEDEHGGDRRASLLALTCAAGPGPFGAATATSQLLRTMTTMKTLALTCIGIALAVLAWSYRSYGTTSPELRVPSGVKTSPLADAPHPDEPPADPAAGAVSERVAAVHVPEVPAYRGRVVDLKGGGLSGVRLTLYPDDLAHLVDPAAAPLDGVSTGTTDEHGAFRIPCGDSHPFMSLRADSPGYSPSVLEGARPNDEHLIVLRAGHALGGGLVGADGQAVPGGSVRVVGVLAGSLHERTAISDMHGRWEIADFPAPAAAPGDAFLADRVWIEASAEGFAPLLLEERYSRLAGPDGRVRPLDLVLTRGNRIAVQVVDAESGAPLVAARVVLWSVEGDLRVSRVGGTPLDASLGERLLAEGLTDAEGQIPFDRVPARGPHRSASHVGDEGGRVIGFVTALVEGRAPASCPVYLREEGENSSVLVRCWPAAGLHGRVVDEAGEPIAGAHVRAQCEERPVAVLPEFLDESSAVSAFTDPGGEFTLAGLPAESRDGARIEVHANHVGLASRAETEAFLVAGEVSEVSALVLRRQRALSVHVEDALGSPVWGALVTSETDSPVAGRTDRDGTATLHFGRHDLPSGEETVRVTVSAPGHARATSEAVRPASPIPAEVRVRIQRAHRLTGRVVGHDGLPASEVLVLAIDATVPPAEIVGEAGILPGVLMSRGSTALGWTRSDDRGTFVLESLPPPPYHLIARAIEPAPGASPEGWLLGYHPDRAEALLVLSPPLPEESRFEGRVTEEASGAPVAGCRLFLRDTRKRYQAQTDEGGAFRFEASLVGTFDLEVRAMGYCLRLVENLVLPADGPMDLTVARGARITGRIVPPTTADLPDHVLLGFTPLQGGPNVLVEVDEAGNYESTALAPGTYRAFFWVGPDREPPFLTVSAHEHLEVGESTTEIRYDVQLTLGAHLYLMVEAVGRRALTDERVASEDGKLASIEVRDDGGEVVLIKPSLEFNSVTMHALPTGHYEVRLLVPGAEPQILEVDLIPDEKELVRFRQRIF